VPSKMLYVDTQLILTQCVSDYVISDRMSFLAMIIFLKQRKKLLNFAHISSGGCWGY